MYTGTECFRNRCVTVMFGILNDVGTIILLLKLRPVALFHFKTFLRSRISLFLLLFFFFFFVQLIFIGHFGLTIAAVALCLRFQQRLLGTYGVWRVFCAAKTILAALENLSIDDSSNEWRENGWLGGYYVNCNGFFFCFRPNHSLCIDHNHCSLQRVIGRSTTCIISLCLHPST